MPLTYAEFNAKRNNVRYWTEYGMTVAPAARYLGEGMLAVADQLASRSPELSRAFREMSDAMFHATGDVNEGDRREDIEDGLKKLTGLYAFLDQTVDGVRNRDRLEQALANDPGLKERFLRTDESKNASFQQQLDSVGDFYVVSQKAIDEQIDRESREKRLAAYEQLQLEHRQRLQVVDGRNIPEAQKTAEKERIQREYEEMLKRLQEGAEYAQEQDRQRKQREAEEKAYQEEQERLRREEAQRREAERLRREQEQRRREQEELRRAELRRQQEESLRRQQAAVRKQHGPFSMPQGYDYRDAAVHFTLGMQAGNPRDSVIFKTADKIHEKRQALEAEVQGIIAGVDESMHRERYYESVGKIPGIRDALISKYGVQGARDKLADREKYPEGEPQIFAEMKTEQLVTDTRRSDLLNRFPTKAKLNAQLEPFRIQARRKILEDRLGGNLELRLRQKENEMTAAALEEKFFLADEYKADLDKVLKNTFGPELEQMKARYAGEPNPTHALFHNEIYLPALRNRERWKKLGDAMGLPRDFTVGNTTEKISEMDVMAQIARKMVKPEAVETALFEDLVRMHPDEALHNKAEKEAEEALYASLHPEQPVPDGSKLFDRWLRDERVRLALGEKREKLDELRQLDEAADGLKKNCLAASGEKPGPALQDKLSKASRCMKDTAIRLAVMEEKDPQQFRELAGELDEEWVKMDLMKSRKLREAQEIPEQYLHAPRQQPLPPWPFVAEQAGEKPQERQFGEYEYHAFDTELQKEKWTDEEVEDEVLEDAQNYSFVDFDIMGDARTDVEKFMDEEWNQLATKEHMSSEEKQLHLSRLVAADSLFLQGKDSPERQEIEKLAEKLRKEGNFKQITDNVDPKIFARTRRVDLIVKCLEKTAPSQEKQAARANQLQQIAASCAANMLATKKGTSYFFGVSRFITGNSTRYEHALGAIQNVQHNPDLNDLGPAVATVKEYLRDKKTKRDREFGQVRWKECMTFLKYAMPRKEFERYCLEVNRARHSLSPEHEDHVSPEMFGPPQTAGQLQDEIMDRIRAGEGTAHDFAVLGALKDMDLAPDVQPDLRQLLMNARNIEGSPALNNMMSLATPGQQLRLAETLLKAEKTEKFKPSSLIKKAGDQLIGGPKAELEGLEEPMGLEKELLDIAMEKKEDPKEELEAELNESGDDLIRGI